MRIHVQVDASQNQQNRQKNRSKNLEQGLCKPFLSSPKVKIWVNKLQFDNTEMKFLVQLFMKLEKTAHIWQRHYWFSLEMTSEK